MPDDINPITPPTITPTEPLATPVAEPAVDEAQSVLDSVVTEVVPDEKPVEDKKTVDTAPTITEHPISDEQAKQFAGMGDFSLPQSPLDNLDSVFGKTEPEKKEDEKAEKPIEGQPIAPMVVSEIKPEVVKQEEVKSEAVKPDLTLPPPAVSSATLAPEDLEKKAEGMLKELNKADGGKPKKKSGGPAAKMALAAVLVVLMGAGGLVGMNLLKMQQVGDQRSQASTCSLPLPSGCGCSPADTNVCSVDSNGSPNYFTQSCGNCIITCRGTKDCTEEVETPPATARCSNPNAAIGAHSCETINGANTGSYCSCNYVSTMAVWQCDIDTTKCPTGASGGGVACGSSDKVEKLGDCLQVKGDVVGNVTFYRSECPGMEDGSDGCQENMVAVEGRSACIYPVPSGFCGFVQLDYDYLNTDCFLSKKIPCSSSSPTPSSSTGSYSCTSLTKDVVAPVLGSQLTFTCNKGGTATVNHYEFRYKVGTGDFTSLAAGTGNKSSKLTIAAKGAYTVECRVCKSTDATDCTAWGAAGK